MPCYHPVRVTINRKAFKPGGLRVLDKQEVPCGSCLGCRAEQARQWQVRLLHEMQMHENAWFLTLTYDDERLPENGSLRAQDFSGFIKAMRRQEGRGISYYGCGEYGDRTERPHYHAVLFGIDFLDKHLLRDSGSSRVWESETLAGYWDNGICEFGVVTPASAAYVAGYVRKKVHKKVNPDNYLRVDPGTGELVQVEKEFARMSLRPAIGMRWIETYWRDVYPRDFVVVDGVEMKPPRYYDKWLERERPALFFEVLQKRDEELAKTEEWRPGRLAAKKKIHEARVSLFQGRDKV